MFVHSDRYPRLELERRMTPEGRVYDVPGLGPLMSVTTALGLDEDKNSDLERWRERIGHDKAELITKRSAKRGQIIHTALESYLKDEPIKDKMMPNIAQMFVQMKKLLQPIGTIYLQESPLYSKRLMLAGTVDCVAEWDGTISIVDFKTSNDRKRIEHVHNYFLQCTAYSMMFEEIYGVKIDQIVVAIAVECDFPQLFVEKADKYKDDKFFVERIAA